MHPAFSVIFFTVFSGTGYGLLALMGMSAALGLLPRNPWLIGAGLIVGVAAVSAGLVSSTIHLGHPERAWRALSQWRTSWLSREGVLAVASYLPVGLLAYYCILHPQGAQGSVALWGTLTAVAAALTVYCTAMIYRSLETIHQWANQWTVLNYLLLGAAGGALWLNVLMQGFDIAGSGAGVMALALVTAAWGAKTRYWRFIDSTGHPSTPESATGLGGFGRVGMFESPHTSGNYLLKEMGFQIARKHSLKLRAYAHALAFLLPSVLLGLTLVVSAPFALVIAVLAALSITVGQLIERWLFFAEAKHVVMLYYGETTR
jgi:DMSO reductase anchor subunit